MKEDVLEQIVDDYLQKLGYFTTHNVRFGPSSADPEYVSRTDAVPSDIDVIGLCPLYEGPERVMVVSCKSWHGGFDATVGLAQLNGTRTDRERRTERMFREVWVPKWARGFRQKIEELTGCDSFTYCVAATRVRGDTAAWNQDETIRENLDGNPVRFLALEEMWHAILGKITTTPEASVTGRLAQLLYAAGLVAATEQ